MPAFFQSAAAFLGVLGVLVFVHELGHYLAARLVRVHVEVFSIGFGPAIAKWRDRVGTEWKLSWLPLGGYVKLHGHERPEAMITDKRPARDGRWREQPGATAVTAEETRWIPGRVFHEKSVGARAIVVAAGP